MRVTASFSASGAGYNRIELAERETDNTDDVDVDKVNPSGTRHTFTGSRGDEYRFRVSRCLDSERKECGDWTSWTRWFEVPNFPADAYDLDWTRARTTLTYSFKISGDPEETKVEVQDWPAGATPSTTTTTYDRSTQNGSITGTREFRYRFRVARCTDAARTDCAGADDRSDWSDWITVPQLPGKPPTPKLSRVKNNLAFSFTVSDASNANHPQKYHLQRTGGNTGTFQDYRNSTANDRKLQGVDRNYSYQLSVSYCTDAGLTDCGAQSNWSASLLVPDLPPDPGTPELEVDDDDLTVSYTATGTAYDELQFQQSSYQTRGFSTYTEGTLNGKVLSNVERNKYYKVQVRRCIDTAFTDCTGWSSESNVVKVGPAPVQAKPTLASRADGKSAVASFTLLDGFDYTLQLQSLRSNTRGATWTAVGSSASLADSATKRTYTGLVGGTSLDYRVRLSACPESTSNNCVNHDSTSITLSKAPAPSVSSLTLATQDDLTVVYTTTAWTNGTGDVYDFAIERAETATGSFADYDDATTPSSTPHVFNNVHTGYYYKARGRRCSDSAATICGDWSRYTAALNVPALSVPAPTSITVSNPSPATVQAAFTPGTLNRRSVQYYVFQIGKSDTETGTFVYGETEETKSTSSVSIDELEVDKWYKVRGKGCLDAAWKRCGDWGDASGAVEVTAIGLTIGSGADGKSVVASLNLFSGFTYTLKLYASAGGKRFDSPAVGSATPASAAIGHVFKGLLGGRQRYYLARLTACTGSTSNTCDDYETGAITLSKAPAPKISGITLADENDLTVGYTLDAWNNGSGDVLDFVIKRADSATDTFAPYGEASSPDKMPHKFNNVHTGYYYKAQARRCSDDELTICGDWSGLSAAVNVPALAAPPKPLNLLVSIVSHTEVKAEFTHSTWPGRDVEPRYVFQVGKSATENGEYVYSDEEDVDAATSVSFDELETGKWYKVRGKRCYFPARKRCGRWAESTTAVETVAPDPKLRFVSSTTTITIDAGIAKSVFVDATGLDRTKSYTVRLESSAPIENSEVSDAVVSEEDNAPKELSKVLKFDKCDTVNPSDQIERSVPARKDRFRVSVKTLYGCQAGRDVVTVNLAEGEDIVNTIHFAVNVTPVPRPTNLRANGHSPRGDAQIALQWTSGKEISKTQYQIDLADGLTGLPIFPITWGPVRDLPASNLITDLVIDQDIRRLYAIRIRSVRNGVASEWSKTVYGFPTDRPLVRKDGKLPVAGGLLIQAYRPGKTYSYVFCANSVRKSDVEGVSITELRSLWASDIEAGAAAWESAVQWGVGGSGANSAPVVRIAGTVDTNCDLRLKPKQIVRAEVRIAANDERLKLACRGLKPEACAELPPENAKEGELDPWLDTKPYIFFNMSPPKPWNPGQSHNAKDLELCSLVERFATHEFGHALGLGHQNRKQTLPVIMSDPISETICEPQPLDIVAIMALYQSR